MQEKEEFETSILEDLEKLGVHPSIVTHTSDNFAYILEKAAILIANGDAYVDDQDKVRRRGRGGAGADAGGRR